MANKEIQKAEYDYLMNRRIEDEHNYDDVEWEVVGKGRGVSNRWGLHIGWSHNSSICCLSNLPMYLFPMLLCRL